MASPSSGKPKAVTVEERGLFPSRNIALDVSGSGVDGRPATVKHMSAPTYQSPLRHHTRAPSRTKRYVKETLNARSEYSNSEDDGTAEHRINQYLIKDEIGRGSFGAVHLAVDQFGREYAVKEFSKSRLRKRAQSNLLRRSNRVPGHFTAGKGFNSPLHRNESGKSNNSLDLIREEIAIMKKLNHPNVVNLMEVLDDPEEDSLYMVMEMCKKGVVMKVGLDQRADPYDEERCWLWFRDMILGIEYLHAQGIIHRDIKPDNCLITDDDVLKIVDFGVSEMFEKDSDMNTTKSAGSPAFMPPELCVAKHGEVSGRAADIWSMGVTLYCLRYGHIPFEKTGVLELYDAIKEDSFEVGQDCPEDFKDLMHRLLEKDPQKRIKMEELREHPWVTKGGSDPLLSKDENIVALVEPPTDEELKNAITGNMGHLMVVMKAVRRFKQLLVRKRPELMEGIFGRASRIVQPPLSIHPLSRSKSTDTDDRRPIEGALTSEGVHRDIPISDGMKRQPEELDHIATYGATPATKTSRWTDRLKLSSRRNQEKPGEPAARQESGKGQAHNPLEDTLILGIGAGGDGAPLEPGEFSAVSESPGAVDVNVYEKAYQEEIEKILAKQGTRPTLYLTRRVEANKDIRDNEHITDHTRTSYGLTSNLGFKKLVEEARVNVESEAADSTKPSDDDNERLRSE